MSSLLIAKTTLRVGPSAANTKRVHVPGTLTLGRSRGTNVRPLPGSIGSRAGGFRTVSASLPAVPSDSYHDPLFRSFPTRLYVDSLLRGYGAGRRMSSFAAASVVTLNLPRGGTLPNWGVEMTADGNPVDAAAPANPDPLVPGALYTTEATEWRFGDADMTADLTAHNRGGSIASTATVISEEFGSGLEPTVMTADIALTGLRFALSANITDTADDDVLKLLELQEGIVSVRRTDANWAYAMSAVLSSDLPVSASDSASATSALTFAQGDNYAVAGVPVTVGGNVPQGQIAYVIGPNGCTAHAAGSAYAVPARGYAVVGAPIAVLP